MFSFGENNVSLDSPVDVFGPGLIESPLNSTSTDVSAVPEPSALLLLVSALATLGFTWRKRKAS
jgi:PEP-CTERM motif